MIRRRTSGTASVCGFDVQTQSMDLRRHIGYLPEQNPLYYDMYVREYLEFTCGIHKIEKNSALNVSKRLSK
ncbi:MAG: hypothetical protein QM743_10060 [Chitinophagaceae bacterium]